MDAQLFYAVLLLADIFVLFVVLSGAPYVPTSNKDVERMVGIALTHPSHRIAADIGAGDGRIVIALARQGIEAHGYEINPFLVWIANRKIRQAGVSNKACVRWKNFWNVNFAPYDVITVFGITQIMPKLEKKLQRELRPGSRVISSIFRFPNWKEVQTEGNLHVYERSE